MAGLKESIPGMIKYSAEPRVCVLYIHDTFFTGKLRRLILFFTEMQTKMAVERPEAGKEQSSLPTSPEENILMSSTKYFKVTGMDLI